MITSSELAVVRSSERLANDIRRAIFSVEEKYISLVTLWNTNDLTAHNERNMNLLFDVLLRLKKLHQNVLTTHAIISENVKNVDITDDEFNMLNIVFQQQRTKLEKLINQVN